MYLELKAKVADNELHIAKLIKEKTQLQERNTSQQEQSIKETSNIGLQFNYLIPSMGKTEIYLYLAVYAIPPIDNLECLSDVQVVEKKLFLVQGDKSQLMNWERFGLRIGVEEDSLSSSETVEVATAALVGGEFKFPKNTVLVSAVYAVTVSKRLLKPLRLEIQHCVDLTGRAGLSKYLKFAIAPVSTPSLPYQFRIIEGGEFSSNSGYGSIERKEFCLVCILGEETTNGVPVASINGDTDEEEEEDQQQQQQEEEEEEMEEEEDCQGKEEDEEQQQEEKEDEEEKEEEWQQQQEEEEEEKALAEEKEVLEDDKEQQDDVEHKAEEEDDDNDFSDSSSESNKTSGPPVASRGTKG